MRANKNLELKDDIVPTPMLQMGKLGQVEQSNQCNQVCQTLKPGLEFSSPDSELNLKRQPLSTQKRERHEKTNTQVNKQNQDEKKKN